MNRFSEPVDATVDFTCTLRVKEFRLPTVPDVLVLGRRSAIGCHALHKAFHLLTPIPLVRLELNDEAISDLLVRESLLRHVSRPYLEGVVLQHVRPRMQADEILGLELDLEWRLQAASRHGPVGCP